MMIDRDKKSLKRIRKKIREFDKNPHISESESLLSGYVHSLLNIIVRLENPISKAEVSDE